MGFGLAVAAAFVSACFCFGPARSRPASFSFLVQFVFGASMPCLSLPDSLPDLGSRSYLQRRGPRTFP
eukprot:7325814-Pyramimonas_sp.AAC.1